MLDPGGVLLVRPGASPPKHIWHARSRFQFLNLWRWWNESLLEGSYHKSKGTKIQILWKPPPLLCRRRFNHVSCI